jgi:hypothetical protein
LIIIDDISGEPMSPEAQARIMEWARLQTDAGNISISTIRLPDGDLLKSLLDRADEEA